MNSCEQYKKILKDRIENIMMSGLSDLSSLEEICKLMDTFCKVDKYSKWGTEYQENYSVEDTIEHEYKHEDDLTKHYNEYIKHKDEYRKSGDLEHKNKMLEHLDKMIECMRKMFENIVNKTFDCQEEREKISQFLQTTFRII